MGLPFVKKNREITTRYRMDLETLRFDRLCPKIYPKLNRTIGRGGDFWAQPIKSECLGFRI